jgi:predicted transcriptional regulator with HTH domain
MEYKYCPNMIVIDTPGMLHAPSKSKLGNNILYYIYYIYYIYIYILYI